MESRPIRWWNTGMSDVIESDRLRIKGAASRAAGGGGGGSMDDVMKRLGVVESSVAEIRAQVSAITAVLPHLASKADVHALRGELKSDIHSMEAAIIKWIVGTAIASVAVASAVAAAVAKFVS
jgi:hypothetical protein